MNIVTVGLNYRTAPVEVRERFAIAEAELPAALQMLKGTPGVLECVIVSTCNRTELYAVTDREHSTDHFNGFMETWFGVPADEFAGHLYVYEDERAIQHMFELASGLDSMVIGETQILGQVRGALFSAQKEQTTGLLFNTLFKQVITMAKRAHAQTNIADNAVSVSYAAVELGKRVFGHFHNKSVLIIGAGKMSELTIKHLHANGAKQVFVANRTMERAQQLADQIAGIPCSLDSLADVLDQVDIVISSTGSSEYVLTYDALQSLINERQNRPLFMIDIAVPRDIDPKIGSLANVYLFDIDDLEGIVEANMDQRRKAAEQIRTMIREEIAAFDKWYRTLDVVPAIRALQQKSVSIHEETMTSMLNKLPDLSEREIAIIRKLTRSMLNQLVQDPIQGIKEMAADRRRDDAVKLFAQLFALSDELTDQQGNSEQEEEVRAKMPAMWMREAIVRF